MQVVIVTNLSATKLGLVTQVTNGSREQPTDSRHRAVWFHSRVPTAGPR